jgi:hypothetical protein
VYTSRPAGAHHESYHHPLAAPLAVLGLEDLIMVPVMVQARSQPPVAATIASGVLGAATLASVPGLAQGAGGPSGRRWHAGSSTRPVPCSARGRPGNPLKAAAAVALVLSVAAIIMLVRFSRRRAVSATSAV